MIDCNCFFGPRSKGRELLAPGDFDPFRKSGIKRFCISTTKLGYYDPMEGNREIMDVCRESDFLVPVVTLQLGMGDIGREGEFLDLDAKLYRLFIDSALPVRFRDGTLSRFLEGLLNKGGSLIVEYGSSIHGLIEQIASGFSGLALVLSGINYPQIRSVLPLFESFSNTFMDISCFSAFNGLEYLKKIIGIDRIIFGTNGPIYAHRSNVIKLQRADLTGKEREKIGEQNFLEAVGGLQ